MRTSAPALDGSELAQVSLAPDDVVVDDPMPAASSGAALAWSRARPDPVVLLAVGLVVLPALVAAGSALRNPWVPTNDWALIELQVRAVGTGDTPLVGAWSRFGWRHPGPLPFYVLAVPYRLVPADRGLLFAAACTNLLATLTYAAVVIRYTRSQAVVALAGLAALQLGLGIDQLSDPWNPTILMVPFALYLVLCVDVAVGQRRWPLPVAVGVGSFIVQSHIGLAQPVLLIGALVIAVRWHFARRDALDRAGPVERGNLWRRWDGWRGLVPTAVVALVAWLPPLIDQVHGSGNLGTIGRWTLGADIGGGMGYLTEGRLPRGQVAGATAWLVEPFGLWMGRTEPVVAFGSPVLGAAAPLGLLWLPLALGGAIVLVRRGRSRTSQRRQVVAAGSVAIAGVVALMTDLATARGVPVFWPFQWAAVVVMLVWVTVGWGVAVAATARFPWIDGTSAQTGPTRPGVGRVKLGAAAAAAVLVAAVAVPVVLSIGWGTLGQQPVQGSSSALLRLAPAVERHAAEEPLMVANTENMLNPVDLALPVILDRAGIPWVDRSDPDAQGYHSFMVAPAATLEDERVEFSMAAGVITLLARSGPPRPGEDPDSELILLRMGPTVWSDSIP